MRRQGRVARIQPLTTFDPAERRFARRHTGHEGRERLADVGGTSVRTIPHGPSMITSTTALRTAATVAWSNLGEIPRCTLVPDADHAPVGIMC
jgi:hypothetical protein